MLERDVKHNCGVQVGELVEAAFCRFERIRAAS
jgi:hypothetical protein